MGKKRKAGEGTLRLRKDGRWEGRIVVDYDENGKPKTKNVTAKTKAECLKKLEALKEKCGIVTGKATPEMPFGDWLDLWYKTYSKPNIRITTQLNPHHHAAQLREPHLSAHHSFHRKDTAQQADAERLAEILRRPQEERAAIKGRALRHGAVRPHGAFLPYHMPHGAAEGGRGKADHRQSCRRLQAAAEKGAGNAGPDPRGNETVSDAIEAKRFL